MGISAASLAAINILARDGQFTDVRNIFEIGAQEVNAAKYGDLVAEIFHSFGKPRPSEERRRHLSTAPARDFWTDLGLEYHSLDTTAEYGAIQIDLNFDTTPETHRGRYDFVSNFGTTEHAFNQHNCFKIIHELTKPGGLMVHHVPLRAIYNVAFYNYHPELFICLARSNGYEMMGMWIDVDFHMPYLLPWTPDYFQFVQFAERCNMHIVVAMRKKHAAEFNVPYQTQYELTRTDESASRYRYTLPNGQVANGFYAKQVAMQGSFAEPGKMPASQLAKLFMSELKFRVRRRFGR